MADLLLLVVTVGLLIFLPLHTRLRRLEAEVRDLKARLVTTPDLFATEPAPVPEPSPPVAEARPPPPPPESPSPEPDPRARPGWEERLARRWLVGLGGVALVIGGGLFVGFMAEQGLLGPWPRVGSGGLFGLALVLLGERLRRRDDGPRIAAALAAAGVAVLMAAVWAAFGLYDLIPPLLALTLLAVVAFSALALSLRHGRLLAILGIAGAFAAPALVGGDADDWAGLCLYLALVLAAALGALTRHRDALTRVVLVVTALAWPALGVLGGVAPLTAVGPLALYLLLLTVGLAALPGLGGARSPADAVPLAGEAAACLLLALLTVIAPTSAPGLSGLLAAAAVILLLAYAWGTSPWSVLPPPLAALLALGAVPAAVPYPDPRLFDVVARLAGGDLLAWGLSLGALTGLGGFALDRRCPSPPVAAWLAALVPPALLTLLWLRLAGVERDGVAVAAALALALLGVEAARRRWATPASLAAYAAGAAGALALGLVILLPAEGVVTGLALEALAIALVWRRLKRRSLLYLLGVFAVLVVTSASARGLWLVALDAPAPDLGRLLVDLLLPALAMLGAWRLTTARRRLPGWPAPAIEAAAILLWTAALAETGRWLGEGAASPALAAAGLTVTGWLATFWRRLPTLRPDASVSTLLSLLLLGLGLGLLLLGPLVFLNPLLTGVAVGAWAVLNALTPAFLVPGLLLLGVARTARTHGWRRASIAAGILGLALTVFWSGLELRRAFVGPALDASMGGGELYAHSLLLLAWAAALLTAGLALGQAGARRAGLALALVAALKVFLVDTADLEGLWRAASFLALGLVLLGLGWLWQRRRTGSTPA